MNRIIYREVQPEGWLKRQLEIQARGLVGNLDQIWPDVRDSAWIGGSREGWERVPYWLDGFIPLAYLLRDESMIARVRRYIDAILLRQQEDGWICPLQGRRTGRIRSLGRAADRQGAGAVCGIHQRRTGGNRPIPSHEKPV